MPELSIEDLQQYNPPEYLEELSEFTQQQAFRELIVLAASKYPAYLLYLRDSFSAVSFHHFDGGSYRVCFYGQLRAMELDQKEVRKILRNLPRNSESQFFSFDWLQTASNYRIQFNNKVYHYTMHTTPLERLGNYLGTISHRDRRKFINNWIQAITNICVKDLKVFTRDQMKEQFNEIMAQLESEKGS